MILFLPDIIGRGILDVWSEIIISINLQYFLHILCTLIIQDIHFLLYRNNWNGYQLIYLKNFFDFPWTKIYIYWDIKARISLYYLQFFLLMYWVWTSRANLGPTLLHLSQFSTLNLALWVDIFPAYPRSFFLVFSSHESLMPNCLSVTVVILEFVLFC